MMSKRERISPEAGNSGSTTYWHPYASDTFAVVDDDDEEEQAILQDNATVLSLTNIYSSHPYSATTTSTIPDRLSMQSFHSAFDNLGVAGSPSLHPPSVTETNTHNLYNNRLHNTQPQLRSSTSGSKMHKLKLAFSGRKGKHHSTNSAVIDPSMSDMSNSSADNLHREPTYSTRASPRTPPPDTESKPAGSPRIGKLTMSFASHVFQKRAFNAGSTGISASNTDAFPSTKLDSRSSAAGHTEPHSPLSPGDVPPPLPPKEHVPSRSQSPVTRTSTPDLHHHRRNASVNAPQPTSQLKKVDIQEDPTVKDGWRKSDLSTTSGHTIRPSAAQNVSSAESPLPSRGESPSPPSVSSNDDRHSRPSRSTSPSGIQREDATPLSFSSTSISTVPSIASLPSSPATSASVHPIGLSQPDSQDTSSPTANHHNQSHSPVRSTKRSMTGMGNMLRNMANWKSSSNVSLNEMINSEVSSNDSHHKETQAPSAYRAPAPDSQSSAPPSSFHQKSAWPPSDPTDTDPRDELPPPASSRNRLRQTATSFTNASAGLALGLGKLAVEKVKAGSGSLNSKVWNSWGNAAHSNKSSEALPTGHSSSRKASRRTPNAPSGSWSEQSVGSGSEASDPKEKPVNRQSPSLGILRREPFQSGGVLFGQTLAFCVEETRAFPQASMEQRDVIPPLEQRALPAIVLRCAQHLHKWGLQEEGLFRISGRASHITILRKEFDSGADWDMSECSPAELDPHAVASVFKAYLRELPESILTRNLGGLFDSAMAAEKTANAMSTSHQTASGTSGSSGSFKMSGLPSSPRGRPQMAKPSATPGGLTTSSGLPAPSELLIRTLAALLTRLPPENRHVLRTVTELICATALRSKFTKMPLTNLLLIFCPTLGMNPPLLRALCENEEVWVPPKPDIVLDIRAKPSTPPVEDKPKALTSSDDDSRASGLGVGPRPPRATRRVPVPALLASDFDTSSALNLKALTELHELPPNADRQYFNENRKSRSHSTSSLLVTPSDMDREEVAAGRFGGRTRASTLTDEAVTAFGHRPFNSVSTSTAASVELPPSTPKELAILSSIVNDDDSTCESQLRQCNVMPPTVEPVVEPVDNQMSLQSNSSDSSLTSAVYPTMTREADVTQVHIPSTSSLTSRSSSFFLSNGPGSLVVPANHEESLQMLRQLKAISESELKGTSSRDLGPIPPLRHVLSLNLLSTRGSTKSPIDTPSSIRSLPSPKSANDANHTRVPSLLGWKLKRRSTDLAALTRAMSDELSEDTAGNEAATPLESPPPKLTLPFETAPSSPINLRVERRRSTELLGTSVTQYRQSGIFGRSRSSPMLGRLMDSTDSPRLYSVEDKIIRDAPLLKHANSLPPTLILNTESTYENDWAQSVLLAANASSDS